jgi:hypothetical protein
MAGVTTAGINYALKYHYLPRLREQIKRSFIFLRIAEKAERAEMTGRSLLVKVETGLTAGISQPSTSGAAFPDATQTTYRELTIPLARTLGTVQVPREDELRGATDAASIVRPLRREIENMRKKFQHNLNWNFHRSSTNVLATVASFSNGSPDTVTLDGPDGCRFLEPGMVIDFYRSASPVSNAVTVTITDITGENTFTCTITGTPVDGDTIHFASSYGNGAQGLDQIIGTTTFQGITISSDNYWWQANVQNDSATPVAFSPLTLKTLLTKIERRQDRDIDLILASPEVYDAMGWVLLGSRMFQGNQAKFEGYWDSFTWGGHTVIKDNDCPYGTIFLVTKECLLLGVLGGELINIVDFDGTTTRMALSSGAYINSMATHFDSYVQLGCTRRTGLGKWTGVIGLLAGSTTYGDTGGLAA